VKKNPVLKFVLLRLGIFAVAFGVLYALSQEPYFSAMVATAIALAISLLFFNKQRGEVSASVDRWTKRKNSADTEAEDAAAEDSATDEDSAL